MSVETHNVSHTKFFCLGKILVLIIYLISIVNCSVEDEVITRQDLSKTDSSQNESFKLINGIESGGYLWAVAIKNTFNNLLCTGSFIQQNLVLTSAHCVISGEDNTRIQYKDFSSIDIFINPQYDPSSPSIEFDLALVKFPNNTNLNIIEISHNPLQDKDTLLMIGFGVNDYELDLETNEPAPSKYSTENIKRYGYNTYILDQDLLDAGAIKSSGLGRNTDQELGNGENVSIGLGDSGGPLLAKKRGLVGIAYGHKYESDEINYSYHTYLQSFSSIEFFTSAKEEGFITEAPPPTKVGEDNQENLEYKAETNIEKEASNTNEDYFEEEQIEPKKKSLSSKKTSTCGTISSNDEKQYSYIILFLFCFPFLLTFFCKPPSRE